MCAATHPDEDPQPSLGWPICNGLHMKVFVAGLGQGSVWVIPVGSSCPSPVPSDSPGPGLGTGIPGLCPHSPHLLGLCPMQNRTHT